MASDDSQTCAFELVEQLCTRAKSEVLGEIGKNQPPLATRFEVLRQRAEKSAEHAALGIIDSVFHGGARPSRKPRRIADHERRAAFWK